jgi:hypothetical protein
MQNGAPVRHEQLVLTAPPHVVTAVLLHQLDAVECMVRNDGHATHVLWTHDRGGGRSYAMSARVAPHPVGSVVDVDRGD